MIRLYTVTTFGMLLLAACFTAILHGAPLPGTPLPNIILITIDTLRADHLSCYGYFRKTSPFIDTFAKDGILFENTVTPIATTLPAHISLFTSTNPMRHGVKGNLKVFSTPLITSDSLSTFAQILERLGYTTAGFISATPIKKPTGISVGFQTYDEPSEKTRNAETTTNSVLEWLSKVKERPLFLWVHYWDPHSPYLPPPPFSSLYKTSDELLAFLHKKRFPEVAPEMHSEVLNVNNLYDGEITYVDTHLNRLFDGLKSNALYDNSVIVVTADHGEGLGQHNWFDHGRIYNEQLFVPLILKLPQKMNLPGKRMTNIVSLIDVLPTITHAINLPLTRKETSQFEGIDMLNENKPRQYVFSERVNRVRPGWEPGLKYALTGPAWKYFHLTQGEDQLYDLSNDHPETKNVIHAHPTVAAQMKNLLLKQIAEYKKRQVPTYDEELLPPSIIEELKSLGYVE